MNSNSSVIIVAFLTSALTSVLAVFVMHKYDIVGAFSGGTVAVPELEGLLESDARKNLDTLGLAMLIAERKAAPDKPKKTVLSQAPLAGTEVPKGYAVSLTISLDQPTVPDIVGRDLAAATVVLEQAGFEIQVGPPVPSDSIDVGKVARQTPTGGMAYSKGRTVTLNPSAGPAAKAVPKVIHTSLKQAKAKIKEAGFEVGTISWRYDDDRSPYVVLGQDPGPDERAEPGSKINLTVNEN